MKYIKMLIKNTFKKQFRKDIDEKSKITFYNLP